MSWRWLLAIIAFAMLFAFGVSMWRFGPPYATRVLGVWMVLTAPLFLITYRMTRARWMLYLGFSLLPLGLVSLLLPFPYWSWYLDTEGAFVSLVGLACAIPLILTFAWTLSVFPESGHVGPRQWLVRTGGPILLTSFTIFATSVWAVADSEAPVAKPQYTQNFAGCYELDFGRWIPGGDEFRRALPAVVPQRIRLDSTYAEGGLLIRPPTWWGRASWVPTGSRSITMTWSDVFNSVNMRLYRWGRDLRGRVIAYSDADWPVPEPRALVHARPTDCANVSTDTLRYGTMRLERGRGR